MINVLVSSLACGLNEAIESKSWLNSEVMWPFVAEFKAEQTLVKCQPRRAESFSFHCTYPLRVRIRRSQSDLAQFSALSVTG